MFASEVFMIFLLLTPTVQWDASVASWRHPHEIIKMANRVL